MVEKNRLIVFMTAMSLVVALSLFATTANGDTFTPPAPDSKTLPANDGGPDGCNSSRFRCVMDGEAVLDNQTGLIWAIDTEILEKSVPWEEAIKFCQNVDIGGQKGWRLPTKDELISILDTSQSNPALPEEDTRLKKRMYISTVHRVKLIIGLAPNMRAITKKLGWFSYRTAW